MQNPPPDWQLPPGVSRGLWDYVHDADLADRYETGLDGSVLAEVDIRYCEKHFATPGRLLDLGCGTGRLLLPFARRGYWVLGVDLSAEMLRVAGEKAQVAGTTVQRLQANLVELHGIADGSFDYAACLFSTLGMISGAAERQRVLEHAWRVLRPGGVFVLHVHNLWFSLRDRAGRSWLLRDRLGMTDGERGTRPMPPHLGLAGLALHHYTRREVTDALTAAGFTIVEVEPVSLSGRLRASWFLGPLRTYGYLVAAKRA